MDKSNLSTYKSISRASAMGTADFRITWSDDGSDLGAFQSALTATVMEEYPTCALGFNRFDNLEGDHFQYDDIDSRTSIINKDASGSPVQPLSNDMVKTED